MVNRHVSVELSQLLRLRLVPVEQREVGVPRFLEGSIHNAFHVLVFAFLEEVGESCPDRIARIKAGEDDCQSIGARIDKYIWKLGT